MSRDKTDDSSMGSDSDDPFAIGECRNIERDGYALQRPRRGRRGNGRGRLSSLCMSSHYSRRPNARHDVEHQGSLPQSDSFHIGCFNLAGESTEDGGRGSSGGSSR
jgi:hypothetical protein